MADIISFASHRVKSTAESEAREWLRFFRRIGDFGASTGWADLPDGALLFFCEERRDGSPSFFDVLMQSHRRDCADCRTEQEPGDRLTVLMNAYFFILDRARLECMRRLGWTEPLPGAGRPILQEVMDPASYDWNAFLATPAPTPGHPSFKDATQAIGAELAPLVRRPHAEAMRLLRLRIAAEADARLPASPMDDIRRIGTNNLNN